MSIIEVYEKHKHLDRVLSDPQFCEDSAMTSISRELWLAIKEAAEQGVQLTAAGVESDGENQTAAATNASPLGGSYENM